jgi:hypothetical protein
MNSLDYLASLSRKEYLYQVFKCISRMFVIKDSDELKINHSMPQK